ncbi:MAG: peptidase M20 [Clostridium cadaveris]|uniref:Peptidase M20 n=1 Tax=Clostridium cadaveris TaxID=1529 RepID=A0A316M530_9CLOT|nr:MAG: peptidase M20 [Clostridium cadaveris]
MKEVIRINQCIDDIEDELITIRRDIHKYAEWGWTEFRTCSKISEYLGKLGFNIRVGREIFNRQTMLGLPNEETLKEQEERAISQGVLKRYVEKMSGGYTGVLATLDTGRAGSTLAFRFDIDANEGIEADSLEHRPFKEGFASINKGAMHCCGHDGHTAIGLGVSKILKNLENELCGKIKIIFQPAEEGVRGAYSMVNAGLLDDVDYLLSGHIGLSTEKVGQIVCNTSGFLATSKIDVEFKGRSTHAGATPEKGKNALLGAATAALNLHTVCQHGDGSSRINVGVLKAGTGRNVVPDRAEMKLEIRGENDQINSYVEKRVKEIIKGAAIMYDLRYNITLAGQAINGNSDVELAKIIENIAKEILEVTEIIKQDKLTGSEDITHMMKRVQENGGKAAYMMFGTKRAADHHNNYFDFDERVLKIAVKTYVSAALYINGREDRT